MKMCPRNLATKSILIDAKHSMKEIEQEKNIPYCNRIVERMSKSHRTDTRKRKIDGHSYCYLKRERYTDMI